MAVDPISPIAPARLRTLLLPIGRIRRSRFLELVKRLQAQNVVRLGDVSPVGRPNRNTFSPLAFPSGMIIYDLSTSVPPTSHLDLFPFEPFREPVAILAIADGKELEPPEPDESSQEKTNGVTGPPHPKPPDLEM
ncbi:hypercellular protein A [Coccidioides immitis H538.4]|uniref:Hypercellular protein A n=1 Tax=Coccidioides immitis H538.4 TaxID=396776 RepID=A0A0J8RXP4_COCIT|nr:hypercellular protein A [Coccidioides immitis H538.4]